MSDWSPTDQATLDRARKHAEAAQNLMQPPVTEEHMNQAMSHLIAANAAAQYLQRRLAGVPAPQRGD